MPCEQLAPTEWDAQLPDLIAQAEADLAPGDDAGLVFEVLDSIAARRGVPMPTGPCFDVEVEEMASWPPGLFLKAFQGIVRDHAWNRVPYCAEFHAYIRDDLAERRARLAQLRLTQAKVRERDRRLAERAEAEWMARGRVAPTQAAVDAVAATLRLAWPDRAIDPAPPATPDRSPPDDPR